MSDDRSRRRREGATGLLAISLAVAGCGAALPPAAPGGTAATPATAPEVAPAPTPDADGDGVPDPDDLCPDVAQPEPGGTGCPPSAPPAAPTILITERVYFERAATAVAEQYLPVIEQWASQLRERPDLRVLEVDGHRSTDEAGALDVQRATAVKALLVARGIAAERLVVAGKGAAAPLDAQDTPDARARNRRVTLVIIESDPP